MFSIERCSIQASDAFTTSLGLARDVIPRVGDCDVAPRDFGFDIPEIVVAHNPEGTNPPT
jgi:hypothetical protein